MWTPMLKINAAAVQWQWALSTLLLCGKNKWGSLTHQAHWCVEYLFWHRRASNGGPSRNLLRGTAAGLRILDNANRGIALPYPPTPPHTPISHITSFIFIFGYNMTGDKKCLEYIQNEVTWGCIERGLLVFIFFGFWSS